MPRLIINADDFGLTHGVNRAIEELHQANALTSATLMANGAAFQDAVAIAHRNPSLGVGCHIVLVDGEPVSQPQDVPSLLQPGTTRLYDSLVQFLLAVHTGKVKAQHIEREATAQIRKIQAAGITPTHIDSHKHTHMFPRVLKPLLSAAIANNICAIRNPIEPAWSAGLARNAFKRRLEVAVLRQFQPAFLAQPQIASGQVKTTQGCLGVSATGSLDGATLQTLLDNMPPGTWELVTHPGYNDQELDAIKTRLRATREVEREALTTHIPNTTAERIHFGQL